MKRQTFQAFTNQHLKLHSASSEQQALHELETINYDILWQADQIKEKIRNQFATVRVRRRKTESDCKEEQLKRTSRQTQSKDSSHYPRGGNSSLTFNVKEKFLPRKTDHQKRHSVGVVSHCNGQSNFGKITIHCLRANREILQQRISHLESHCNFTNRKLKCMKLEREKQHNLSAKLQEIIQSERQQSQQLKCLSNAKDAQTKDIQDRIRQKVKEQRVQKQKALCRSLRKKTDFGLQTRLESKMIKEQKKVTEAEQMSRRRIICQKIKEQSIEKRQIRQKKAQNRKLRAKINFKNKWQTESDLLSQTEQTLQEQQDIFASKMRQALRKFSKMSEKTI